MVNRHDIVRCGIFQPVIPSLDPGITIGTRVTKLIDTVDPHIQVQSVIMSRTSVKRLRQKQRFRPVFTNRERPDISLITILLRLKQVTLFHIQPQTQLIYRSIREQLSA